MNQLAPGTATDRRDWPAWDRGDTGSGKVAKGARILVVEEDINTRTMLELALSYNGSGHSVFTAPNGRSALLQFGIVQPDVIVLDITMAGDDGWRALQRIRSLSTVPVIALAPRNDHDTVVRCLQSGADYCMEKPIGMRELHARIRALLRRNQIGEL